MTDDLFTEDDIRQIQERGIEPAIAREQIRMLRGSARSAALLRPCTVGDGIEVIGERAEELERAGEAAAAAGRVTKFVPASGAATRMFKELVASLENQAVRPSQSGASTFFEKLNAFPFAGELRARASMATTPATEDQERQLLAALLHDMGYAFRPKGLIPFHRSEDGTRTAFHEHLIEACKLARSNEGRCRVHFTVSAESVEEFEAALEAAAPQVKSALDCELEVTFSIQHPSTDTLAVDRDGAPFRGADGNLLFRPGGHGALIHNLEQLGADIVVIKNIDNVLPGAAQDEAVRWKKILVGLLAGLQRKAFELLDACSRETASSEDFDRAIEFAAATFRRKSPGPLVSADEKRQGAFDALVRPIRVCGVVRNEGEPGGAPFWTLAPGGIETIQIVESSQVNFADRDQERIWLSSTHFNPVDIVCGLRDWTGQPYALDKFVDRSAVFVARKSHEGRELHALELPGLWNGAMAWWNTVCVEVPASTFAPVKTVFDLLRPQHQPSTD